jgi:hypothetical protein
LVLCVIASSCLGYYGLLAIVGVGVDQGGRSAGEGFCGCGEVKAVMEVVEIEARVYDFEVVEDVEDVDGPLYAHQRM